MKRTRLLLSLLAGALLAAGVAAAASVGLGSSSLTSTTKTLTRQTCTIAPSQDTYVDSATRNKSFGTATTLLVTPGSALAYVQFNLAGCSLPAAATVDSASLRVVATVAPSSRTLSVARVTSSWTTALTWGSTQPTVATPASATIATGTTTGTKTADVTADVDAWIRGAATNFGWRLSDEGTGTATTTLGSAENTANVPSLVIIYVF